MFMKNNALPIRYDNPCPKASTNSNQDFNIRASSESLPVKAGVGIDFMKKVNKTVGPADGDDLCGSRVVSQGNAFGEAWWAMPPQTQPTSSRKADVTLLQKQSAQVYDRNTFHRSISSILVSAQVFGLLPVSGILDPSPAKLQFRRTSFRVIYGVVLFIGVIIIEGIAITHMISTLHADTFGVLGGLGAATAGAVFYGNAVLGAYLFIRLAGRWPTLINTWTEMERTLTRGKQPLLKFRFNVLTSIVMLLALGEHILSILNAVPKFIDKHWRESTISTNETYYYSSGSWSEFLHEYSFNSHAFIFDHVGYSPVSAVAVFVLSKLTTFTWNFTDLFVMLVSTGLAERFRQFNDNILECNVASLDRSDWCELRKNFAVLASLVKTVDDNVCGIVFLSFGNNLYFICLQLLNGLSPGSTDWISTVYFFYSFAFLLGRTILVTLLAARINDHSKDSLSVIFSCPTESFNVEVSRLQHQMVSDDLALTGLRFFSVTRSFLLAVAGVIATYEIVLLQFNVAIQDKFSRNETSITTRVS